MYNENSFGRFDSLERIGVVSFFFPQVLPGVQQKVRLDMSTENLVSELSAAVAARKDSLKALRGRIQEILEPIPVGVKLTDDEGVVCEIIRACTGASQWANQEWNVTITGWAAIAEGYLLCEGLDKSYWDGRNNHVRSNEPTCRYANGEHGAQLSWLSGEKTRKLAARLPAAIARYVAECEQEKLANDATLV